MWNFLPCSPTRSCRKKTGPVRGELHQRSDHQEEREQDPERGGRAGDVQQALQQPQLGLDGGADVMEEPVGDCLGGHRLRPPHPHAVRREGEGNAEGLAGPHRRLKRLLLGVLQPAEVDLLEHLLLEHAREIARFAEQPSLQRRRHLLPGPAQIAALGVTPAEILTGDPPQRASSDDQHLPRRPRARTDVGEHRDPEQRLQRQRDGEHPRQVRRGLTKQSAAEAEHRGHREKDEQREDQVFPHRPLDGVGVVTRHGAGAPEHAHRAECPHDPDGPRRVRGCHRARRDDCEIEDQSELRGRRGCKSLNADRHQRLPAHEDCARELESVRRRRGSLSHHAGAHKRIL